MRNFKKFMAMILLYAITVTILPVAILETRVNAEENIPQYLQYSNIYLGNVNLYQDKVFATVNNALWDDRNMLIKGYEKGVEKFSEDNFLGEGGHYLQHYNQGDSVYLNISSYNTEVTNSYKKYNFDLNQTEIINKEEFDNNSYSESVNCEEAIVNAVNTKFGTNYSYSRENGDIIQSNRLRGSEIVIFIFNSGTDDKRYDGVIGNNISFITDESKRLRVDYDSNLKTINVIIEEKKYTQNNVNYSYTVASIKDNKVVSEGTLKVSNNDDWGYKIKVGKDLYLGNIKDRLIEQYRLQNGEYKRIASHKVTSTDIAIDIYGNPWFISDINGRRYVCTIENDALVKKYEISKYDNGPAIYAYDENNIVLTSDFGTTMITGKEGQPKPTIDQLYANAYNAMLKAQSQKTQVSINEGRKALDIFCEAIVESGDAGLQALANTISVGFDEVQGPIYVDVVAKIIAIQNKGFATQEEINEVRIILEGYDQFDISDDVDVAYAKTWHADMDVYQEKLYMKMINAVEKAQKEQTQEAVNVAQDLVSEVSTAIREDINALAQRYQDILNTVIIK